MRARRHRALITGIEFPTRRRSRATDQVAPGARERRRRHRAYLAGKYRPRQSPKDAEEPSAALLVANLPSVRRQRSAPLTATARRARLPRAHSGAASGPPVRVGTGLFPLGPRGNRRNGRRNALLLFREFSRPCDLLGMLHVTGSRVHGVQGIRVPPGPTQARGAPTPWHTQGGPNARSDASGRRPSRRAPVSHPPLPRVIPKRTQLHSTVPSALNPRPPQAVPTFAFPPPEASPTRPTFPTPLAQASPSRRSPPAGRQKVLLEARPRPKRATAPPRPMGRQGRPSRRRRGLRAAGRGAAQFGRRGEAPKDAPRRTAGEGHARMGSPRRRRPKRRGPAQPGLFQALAAELVPASPPVAELLGRREGRMLGPVRTPGGPSAALRCADRLGGVRRPGRAPRLLSADGRRCSRSRAGGTPCAPMAAILLPTVPRLRARGRDGQGSALTSQDSSSARPLTRLPR